MGTDVDNARLTNWLLGICATLLCAGAIAAFSTMNNVAQVQGSIAPMLEAIKQNSQRIDQIDKTQRDRSPRVYGVEIQLKTIEKKLDEMREWQKSLSDRLNKVEDGN